MAHVRASDDSAARPEARAVTSESSRIEDLRIEARYRHERYDLYRAKMYGVRPTSLARLRELERAHQGADARLRHAERERASHSRDRPAR